MFNFLDPRVSIGANVGRSVGNDVEFVCGEWVDLALPMLYYVLLLPEDFFWSHALGGLW